MKRIFGAIVCITVVFCFQQGLAQFAVPSQMRSQIAMDQLRGGATNQVNNVVYGLPAPPGRVVGDEYLDTKWNVGNVMMQSGDILERYKVRYDLKGQLLEIESMQGVKLLDYKLIKSIVWLDSETQATRVFVNAAAYKDEGVPLIGILEVLVDGQAPLMRRHYLYVKQPDYVPALDVGSRDTQIFKKNEILYASGGDLFEIKGRKSLTALFGDHSAKVDDYIKANDLGVKRDSDLVRVFEYYNSLVTPTGQP
jgi:hypothetical protein